MSPANTKLAIFPASGGLGGATLTHLLNTHRANPKDVVLVARSPEKLESWAAKGIEVRKADYDDADSLAHAFDGVKTLNLISYASIEHEHRFEVHKLAIDAALASGVSHILYSSLAFGGLPSTSHPPSTVAQVMLAHVQTERYLASLHAAHPEFHYSVLRQGIYSESFSLYTSSLSLSGPPRDGTVSLPHDGTGPGIAWAKRDELGEATAKILLVAFQNQDDSRFAPLLNATTLISGPKSYTLAETVAIVGRAVGRELTVKEITVDEYVALPQVKASEDYGGGEVWPRLWATIFEGIRRNEGGNVTGVLEEWLGRKPEAFEETIRQMVAQGDQAGH